MTSENEEDEKNTQKSKFDLDVKKTLYPVEKICWRLREKWRRLKIEVSYIRERGWERKWNAELIMG